MTPLPQSFFADKGTTVAKNLLGKLLITNIDGKRQTTFITETEGYHGYDDKASHGYRGKTKRNSIMFETVGYTYIYLCYGIHWLLNVTTYKPDFPSAVLIRGVYDPISKVHYNGPGKLTKFLGITRAEQGASLFNKNSPIFIADRLVKPRMIQTSARIGVNYAEESQFWPWRFYLLEKEYKNFTVESLSME